MCERTFSGHTDSVTTCHISKDSRFAASGSMDCTVRFWDLLTGECLTVVKKHTRWVKKVRFSVDGRYLTTAGLDKYVATFHLFDLGVFSSGILSYS